MNKTLQVQPFGAGRAHKADFVNGEFTRQDNPAGPQSASLQQTLRMGEVGQGREKKPALKARLTGQIQQGQILDDQAVGPHLTGQPGRQPEGLGGLVRLKQGVHGHINARARSVGQVRQARKLGEAEIFGLHAGRKIFEPQIDGVRPGGQPGQKGRNIPRRGEDFGALRRGNGQEGRALEGHDL